MDFEERIKLLETRNENQAIEIVELKARCDTQTKMISDLQTKFFVFENTIKDQFPIKIPYDDKIHPVEMLSIEEFVNRGRRTDNGYISAKINEVESVLQDHHVHLATHEHDIKTLAMTELKISSKIDELDESVLTYMVNTDQTIKEHSALIDNLQDSTIALDDQVANLEIKIEESGLDEIDEEESSSDDFDEDGDKIISDEELHASIVENIAMHGDPVKRLVTEYANLEIMLGKAIDYERKRIDMLEQCDDNLIESMNTINAEHDKHIGDIETRVLVMRDEISELKQARESHNTRFMKHEHRFNKIEATLGGDGFVSARRAHAPEGLRFALPSESPQVQDMPPLQTENGLVFPIPGLH